MTLMRIAVLTFGLLLPGAAASAEPLPMPREVRIDRFGDPLPEGALARLGTTRGKHPGAKHLTFNADGSRFVTWGDDSRVCIWNTATGERLHIWSLPFAHQPFLCVSNDGQMVGISTGTHFEIWNIEQRKVMRKLPLGDALRFSAAAFAHDGRQLATVDYTPNEHRIRVWDLANGKQRIIGTTEGEVEQLLFNADGSRLFSNAAEKICYAAWDIVNDRQLWRADGGPCSHQILNVSPNGRRLVVQDRGPAGDPVTSALDTMTGKPTDTKSGLGYDKWYAAYSSDGERLAIVHGPAEYVQIHDLQIRKDASKIAAPVEHAVFRPDGKALQVLEQGGRVQAYDVVTGRLLYPNRTWIGHTSEVHLLAWSPDGQLIASAGDWNDQTVKVWDATTSRETCSVPNNKSRLTVFLDFNDDSRTLFICSGSRIEHWDIKKEKELLGAKGKLNFDVEGRRAIEVIAFARHRGSNRFEVLATYPLDKGQINYLANYDLSVKSAKATDLDHYELTNLHDSLSPHRALVADRVYRTATGEVLTSLSVNADETRAYLGRQISPDGRLAVCYGTNSSAAQRGIEDLSVFDLMSGQVLGSCRKSSGPVRFSNDCRMLGFTDKGVVRIWDFAQDRQFSVNRSPSSENRLEFENSPTVLLFSPDSSRMAVGYRETSILIWNVPKFAALQATDLARDQLDSLWSDLAASDAKRAWAAVWRLQDRPEQAMKLFRGRLKPTQSPSAEDTKKLIADLNAESFREREAASKQLAELGDSAKASLEAALKAKPSAEQEKRLKELLSQLHSRQPPRGNDLRNIRALAVLEFIKTDEAKQLIVNLAKGLDSTRSTREAKETCERLGIAP